MDILFIDDNTDILEIFSEILEGAGHKVETACDGMSALKLYREQKPDLIVSDIIIPGINGIDLIKKIRLTDNKTPIIVMSGYEDELAWAKRVGASEVFLKPPNIKKLLETVDEIARELNKEAAWRVRTTF